MNKLNLIVWLVALFFVACTPVKTNTEVIESDFSGRLTSKEIASGRLSPEMLWKFGRIASSGISTNGEKVVYSVKRYDCKTLGRTSNIFVVPSEGGVSVKLTQNRYNDLAPVWIAMGKQIAFLSNRSGDTQVWVMNADGSDAKQLSKIAGGVNAFKISPNGKHLMYTQDVKMETSILEKHNDLPAANAMVMDNLMYRHWNDWTDYNFSHIFISTLENGRAGAGVDIMEGEMWDAPLSPYFDESEIAWSPDGKTLAYTCKKRYGRDYAVSTNSDIYLYDLETQITRNVTSVNRGYDKHPVFSPDGSKMAFMSMETPGYESDKKRLMVLNLASGVKEYLNEDWDQNAHSFIWSDDGTEIFFISGWHAKDQIYKVDIANKEFTPITKGQHRYIGFSKAGNKILGAKTTHQMATELFVVDAESGTEKQLSFVNKEIYQQIKMGHSEERWVKTSDGKDMLVWVIYPPNFDKNKKYPALLYCKGGPHSAVSQFFSYRWNFALMAANDYIIVAPNRRGLPSFGKEWNDQISTDYSGQNINDYLSAIDALKKEPFVDENRLGCIGASYGGYSTFFLAGHHHKRFKAFISHCGMYNLESFYGATEETFFPQHDLGGAYWDLDNKAAQKSYANSPHRFVQNWDTPIMIIHGGKDFRIPYTESLQAFNAAQLQGIPSRLLYFPEETHYVTQAQNSILWQREFFSWLDTYLK